MIALSSLVVASVFLVLRPVSGLQQTSSRQRCSTSEDCPEGEGCIGLVNVNGKTIAAECKKYDCEFIGKSVNSDGGESFKYFSREERAYCCLKGFIKESLCTSTTSARSTSTTSAVTSTTTTTTTTTAKITTTSLRTLPSVTASSSTQKKSSTTSATTDSQEPCIQHNYEPARFLLSGTLVIKGLSADTEDSFRKVFLSIVLRCPLMQLSCKYGDGSDDGVCEYELRYSTKDFADTQLRLLSSIHFSTTLNSQLKEKGEQIKVIQHAPPTSIYEIENSNAPEDLIMIVAIISAVSAGGVLVLVVIAIIAFAVIASRPADEEEDDDFAMATVVASSTPNDRRRTPHATITPPSKGQVYKGSHMVAKPTPGNCVSLDLNAAYSHEDDDSFTFVGDSANQSVAGHERSDSAYSC